MLLYYPFFHIAENPKPFPSKPFKITMSASNSILLLSWNIHCYTLNLTGSQVERHRDLASLGQPCFQPYPTKPNIQFWHRNLYFPRINPFVVLPGFRWEDSEDLASHAREFMSANMRAATIVAQRNATKKWTRIYKHFEHRVEEWRMAV